MSDHFSDSPVAVEALVGALDSEAGKGTSEAPPAPAEGSQPGQDAPKPEVEPSQTPDGTTAPKPQETATAASEGQKQSPFPKDLEPYKSLFEKKKWDPTKPEWHGEVLRAFTEQEQFQGRLTTDLGLTRRESAELSQALLGTPQDINAYRQREGLSPLPFEASSLEDRLKTAQEDWKTLQEALSTDERISVAATQKLAQAFQKKVADLELDKRIAERNPAKPAAANPDSKVNWARILERDPEANKVMTALVPYLKSPAGNGLFGSFGMTVQNIMATPERAQQAYELAKRLALGDPANFEAEVSRRVKAEMEQNRQRQVAGGIPGGATAAASTTTHADPALEHLAAIRA